jgi:hypothetical protein
MPEPSHRFADPGTGLSELARHFVVHCPRCDGKALVHPDGRLVCTACFHVERPGRWYGAATATVAVKCRECHAPLRRSAEWDGSWKKLAMHCSECGDNCEYEAAISRHALHQGRMTDSTYGLPLWLQKEFRGDLFWAFNYDHLEILRRYVEARLRERGIDPRNSIRKNSAMVSRLPAFIKKAGNREALLGMIGELEKQ